MVKGTLIPIGGNEDKGDGLTDEYSLDFVEQGILSHVVRESGGSDAFIIVIPTASRIPKEVGANYLDAFGKLGCNNVQVLDIRSKSESEKPEFIEALKKANCVMFSGGDQSKIAKKIGGTTFHKILAERYANDAGFVIAGTSAGAMAMSSEMIAGGSSTEAFFKDSVSMYHGLGLAPDIIFDTHFIMRGRFGRICEAVAKHPNLIGVGLAEDTGLVIKNGDDMKVIGSGMVIIFDGRSLVHNNEEILEPGTPMTLTDLRVHILSNSDRYSLSNKGVTVLPIDAPFEYD
ncbi:MAG: cyanophycinase [Bacteroidia bacterium]|jgi:cyanophycinase